MKIIGPVEEHGYVWTTKNELEFLDGIGFRNDAPRKYGMDVMPYRIQVLEGYLRGFSDRTDWGAMNSFTVLEYAEESLRLAKN
jgi:hypothetical protein